MDRTQELRGVMNLQNVGIREGRVVKDVERAKRERKYRSLI